MDINKLNMAAELLKALGHPVRLRMVSGICRDECNVNQVVKRLGLPQSTVSQHLAILKAHGIVAPQKTGVSTCYKVVDERVPAMLKALGICGG